MNIRKFGTVNGITNQPNGLDIGAGINTGDATVTAADIVLGKIGYGPLGKLTGTGSNIKSIQTIQGVTAAGNPQVNIAITSVVTANSIIMVESYNSASSTTASNNIALRGKLTSSTNLELDCASGAAVVTYVCTVIEFNNVKNIQTGQKVLTLASDTVTITSVNTNKAILFHSQSNGQSNAGAIVPMIAALTNATTITFNQFSTATFTVEWQVVEFN